MKKRKLLLDDFDTAIDGNYTLTQLKFPLPQIQEQRQEIAGMDGEIDHADDVLGRPVYKTRQLDAVLESSCGSRAARYDMYLYLAQRFHGRRVQIGLPDRPGFLAQGRVSLSLDIDHPAYTAIKISAVCDPFLQASVVDRRTIAVLPSTATLINANNITLLSDYTTAEDVYTSQLISGLTSFGILGADIGCCAVWRLTLSANSSFYVSARMLSGRGRWFVATSPAATDGHRGLIRTGSDGFAYLCIEKHSTGRIELSPVIVLPESQMVRIDSGAVAVSAEISYYSPGAPSVAIMMNGELSVYSLSSRAPIVKALPSNMSYIAAVKAGYAGNPDQIDVEWRRTEL